MDWFILGIEPTKDKKAITDAYRQKLRQTNPEDKPEEFKALRTAYEEALAFASQADTEAVRDESPVGLWAEAIEKLYEDYASRINPALWQELMGSDVCMGLDTRPAAEEALLKFLLESYYLPKAVWQVLDETFRFSARTEELYETWPREFIDHAVLAGIRFDPALDYALFSPGTNGKDCDAYRRLYAQASQSALEETGAVLEQMDALSERHPQGEALRCRFYMETGREAEGKEGLCRLAAAYPDNAMLTLPWADICLQDGNVEEAQRIAAHIKEIQPESVFAKTVIAKCLAEKKQYHEAKECAYEILRASAENPMLAEQTTQMIRLWNEQLIGQREAAYAQNPQDADNAIELAWCYMQNDRAEDAMALAAKIDPNGELVFEYHNLMGKLYHNTNKFEEALPHLQAAEKALRSAADEDAEKSRKRAVKLPEILQIQGNCLMQLGRTGEAKQVFEKALAEAPEDVEVLSLMGKILYNSGDYPYTIEICQRLLQISPGAWVSELLLALSLYHLRRDREAFEVVNRALALQGDDLSFYLLKMQILIRNEVFDEVREILNFLKESGAPEDIAIDFIRAELTELEEKDVDGTLKQYNALRKRVEAGENLLFATELYYRFAVLMGDNFDISQEKNRKAILQLIDKGLAIQAQNGDLLSYKAWVLKQIGQEAEALAMYRALEEKDPKAPAVLRGIADLYYGDLSRNAGEALAYYEKLLQQQKTPELYFYAATCKLQLGDMEGARGYYLQELEMDPEDIDAFNGLALICDSMGNYDESLKLLDQGLTIMETYDRAFDPLVEHKAKVLRRLGRLEEAFSFAQEAAKRYHFGGSFQLRFDICCQAGWWDRAKQVLAQWKLANRNDPDLMAATGRLHLLQGKMFKAAFAMGPAKHKLPARQVQDFRLQLVELEQNYSRQTELLSQRVRLDPNDDHALSLLALAYWRLGNQSAARGAAQKALVLLDDTLSQNLTDEALYRGRRSLVLAILGRTEEARAELANTRKLPLCHFCEYGSCKDADIYEAQIEEILGNTERAQKLYTEGKTKWPDDLDFVSGQLRMKKKGRK